MSIDQHTASTEEFKRWLAVIRERVLCTYPDLLPRFETYAEEALFGRQLISDHIMALPKKARILEVGAGMLLLSSQLQREGFEVTAIEPVGDGFSHFSQLQEIVKNLAAEMGFAPQIRSIGAESLDYQTVFDFAFSINVMEHVNNVKDVLLRIHAALKPNSCYYFVCPNYSFPYEPHFSLPTLVSKKLTERVLGHLIRKSEKVADPLGTWQSLNWITAGTVREICRSFLNQNPIFDKKILLKFVYRSLHDTNFKARRGHMLIFIVTALEKLGFIVLLARLPTVCQPAMACLIRRS